MRYLFTALVGILFVAPFSVGAQVNDGPLSVSFDSTPLFEAVDLLPGAETDSGFTATNNTNETLELYIHFIEDSQSGGISGTSLADVIDVTVTENGGSPQTHTLAEWFDAGQESIKNGFDGGDSASFVLDATFNTSADDGYQNSEVVFDVCIGLSGADEVCVEDDTTTPSDPDDGGSTEGNEGSSVTGTRVTRGNVSDTTNVNPDGIVAGASTSLPDSIGSFIHDTVPSWIDSAKAAVAGTSTDRIASTTADTGVGATTTNENASDAVGSTTNPEENCTLWWLLLLVGISFVWSVIDDLVRNKQQQLFVRNAVFSGIYIGALVIAHFFNFLESIWILFALAWTLMTAFDYKMHADIGLWSSGIRNLFYAFAGIVLVIASLLTGFPCIWWPFALIVIGSLLLLFFDTN